jgi:glycosyltransferase involved in cell wall biosynthesis
VGVREGGNERYCESIIRRLGRAAAPSDEYYVFSYRGAAVARLADGRLTHVPLRRRSVAWQRAVELPRHARRLDLDVLHVPFNFLPTGRARKIVTIYDLAFLHLPETHGPVERARLLLLTRPSARRADHVLTASEFVKRDIVERYGVPPSRITVAPCAVERDAFRVPSNAEREGFRRRTGLTFEYLLHVGTLHPRKNLPVLIEAYARLRARGRTEHHLVLVGRPERGAADVFRLIRARGIEAVVHHIDTLDAAALAGAYGAATALVLPSLYEGFGVPTLEAMSCGCPVLSSWTGALPEVCGEAAILFDPRDAEALAVHLERIVDDTALRHDLARRGLANCARFSWERTAALVAEVYHAA